MPLLLDVLQIIARGAIGGIFLAHVAKAAGEFGEPLAIGAFSEPTDFEVIGLEESRTREEGDYGFGIVQVGYSGRKLNASAGET
jgi:hypothetical protein